MSIDILLNKLNFSDAERKALEDASTEEAEKIIESKIIAHNEKVTEPLHGKIRELKEEIDWTSKRTDDDKSRELERYKTEVRELKVNQTLTDIQRKVMKDRGITSIPNVGMLHGIIKHHYDIQPDGKLEISRSVKDLPSELITTQYETALNRWIDGQMVTETGQGGSTSYLDEQARKKDAQEQIRRIHRNKTKVSREKMEALHRAAGTYDGLDGIADKLKVR